MFNVVMKNILDEWKLNASLVYKTLFFIILFK